MLLVVTEDDDEDGRSNHHTKYQHIGNEKRPCEGDGKGMFLTDV